MRRRATQLARGESGAQVVEFVLIVPVLLILVLGIINFGWVFGQKLSLNQAVREGARKAVVDSSASQPTVAGYVQGATGGLISNPTTSITVATAIQTKTASSPPTFGTPWRSALTCADYTTTEGLGGQLRVTATYQASWLLPTFIPLTAPNLKSEAVYRCEVI